MDEELQLSGLRSCYPHLLTPTLRDVVAVVAIKGRDFGRARFITEIAPYSEGTVRPTAATDTNPLAVAV